VSGHSFVRSCSSPVCNHGEQQGLEAFLQRYSNADLQVIVKVLGDLMAVEKVGVRIAIPE
jgi:hypothetical protein